MKPEDMDAWRDGAFLVLRKANSEAPSRCIITNRPVFENRRLSRRLSWGNEGPSGCWVPMLFKVSFSLIDIGRVTVRFGLDGTHHVLRYALMCLCVGLIAIGGHLFLGGIQSGVVPPPMLPLGGGAALIVIALTVLVNTYSIISIVLMDDDFVWIRGPKEPFLSSLPAFPRNDPDAISKIRADRRGQAD